VFVPSSRFFQHLHQNKTRDRKSVKGIVMLRVEASSTVLTFNFDRVCQMSDAFQWYSHIDEWSMTHSDEVVDTCGRGINESFMCVIQLPSIQMPAAHPMQGLQASGNFVPSHRPCFCA